MGREKLVFDYTNNQIDYKYMAKDLMTEQWQIGYLVVDKPWYSSPNHWTYYIVQNEYRPGGFCGGAIDLGLKKTVVDSTTIEPYTQIAHIKFNQSIGLTTDLIKQFDAFDETKGNLIISIAPNDEIPIYLWSTIKEDCRKMKLYKFMFRQNDYFIEGYGCATEAKDLMEDIFLSEKFKNTEIKDFECHEIKEGWEVSDVH